MNDRLYRSRDDRMLAGVAGGLADMWDADPSLVRIVWAVLVVLTGGLALLIYIVMAIVVHEEDGVTGPWPTASADVPPPPADAATTTAAPGWTPPGGQPSAAREAARAARREARAARRAARGDRGGFPGVAIFGIILVGLGVYFLAREWLPEIDFDWFWPVVLVGIGVLLLVTSLNRRPDDPGDAP
jgi:phage shock protein C